MAAKVTHMHQRVLYSTQEINFHGEVQDSEIYDQILAITSILMQCNVHAH